jgi:hypothetical protein
MKHALLMMMSWAAAVVPSALGQQSAATASVAMVVTVEPHKGKGPLQLYREDIVVFQGKERGHATEWTPLEGEKAPLELFLLVDEASDASVGSQLGALRQFIERQPATTAIGIAYMRNGTAEVLRAPTTDHALAARSLRLPLSSFGVMASPYLSLEDLVKKWPAGAIRREVVMVASGVDPLGGTGPANGYLTAAIESAQRAGVIVFAIYTPPVGHFGQSRWRLTWGQNLLAQLAEETGGEAYMLGPEPPVSFEPYLDDLGEHLRHQYLVRFPANAERKARYQQVRFATEVPNAEIRSATSVYVPPVR